MRFLLDIEVHRSQDILFTCPFSWQGERRDQNRGLQPMRLFRYLSVSLKQSADVPIAEELVKLLQKT